VPVDPVSRAEIVGVWRGQPSLTIRHPWVVAFAFGRSKQRDVAESLTECQ